MILVGKTLMLISIISIFLNKKDKIFYLLSIELYFIGIWLILINESLVFDDCTGIINSIVILSISAIESAVGLTILTNRMKLSSPFSPFLK